MLIKWNNHNRKYSRKRMSVKESEKKVFSFVVAIPELMIVKIHAKNRNEHCDQEQIISDSSLFVN